MQHLGVVFAVSALALATAYPYPQRGAFRPPHLLPPPGGHPQYSPHPPRYTRTPQYQDSPPQSFQHAPIYEQRFRETPERFEQQGIQRFEQQAVPQSDVYVPIPQPETYAPVRQSETYVPVQVSQSEAYVPVTQSDAYVPVQPQYVRVPEQQEQRLPFVEGPPRGIGGGQQLVLLPPVQKPVAQKVQEPKKPLVDLLDPNFRLIDLTDEHMDIFLDDEEAVTMLSDCFMDVGECNSASAVNLIKQIRSLGTGAKCESCTPEEQKKIEDIVYKFILRYSTSYPLLWIRALPRLGYLLTSGMFE